MSSFPPLANSWVCVLEALYVFFCLFCLVIFKLLFAPLEGGLRKLVPFCFVFSFSKNGLFRDFPTHSSCFCRPVSDCFLFSLSSVGNRNSSVLFVCITVCGFFVCFVCFYCCSLVNDCRNWAVFFYNIQNIVCFIFFNMTSNAFLRVELWREEYTQHTNTLVCLFFC